MQTSGSISLSNVKGHFGNAFNSLSNCYGIAAGVPTTGAIALSNLYGKSASTPSIGSISTSNVSTHTSSQSGTISLASLVSDTYGAPFTYSGPTYSASYFSSASVASGVLSFSVPGNKFALSAPISVTVTNRFGRTATISYPFKITGSNLAYSSIGSTSITNNTVSYNMASYFTDYSGAGLSYTITSNPYSNAYLSGSTLYVPGNYRNTSYNVTVQASNSYGQTASTTITVTESIAPPSASSMGSTGNLSTSYVTYYLYSYFSGTITSFSVTSNPYSSASISGNYLYIYPNNRNTSYYVTVTAYNAGGSASSSLLVTEVAAAPSASSMGSTSTLSTNTVSYYLYSYFSGTITSFSVTSNPYSSASISGNYLYIYPNNRGTSYYVNVTAYNSGGSATASLYVTEGSSITNFISYNDWYNILTRYTNGSFAISQTGSDPDVQLQMNSASYGGNITHAYASRRLQDCTTVSFEFEIYITTSSSADSIFMYMGYNSTPSSSFYEGTYTTAYQIVFYIYPWGSLSQGIHIIKNGSSLPVASYSTSSHIASRWIPCKVIYNQSSSNTFQVYFDGSLILTYNDSSYSGYVSSSGPYWGFGSRTGGATGDFFLRRLQVGTSPAITSVVTNGSFTNGTTGWSSATGWATWGSGSQPSTTPSGSEGLLGFSYADGQSVTQTITGLRSQYSWTFKFSVKSISLQGGQNDIYSAYVTFYNSSNTPLQTIGYNYSTTLNFTDYREYAFTSTTDLTSATKAIITLTGKDNGSWGGQYGPGMSRISLY